MKLTTEGFFERLEDSDATFEDVAKELGISNPRTISNWRSIGIPERKKPFVDKFVESWEERKVLALNHKGIIPLEVDRITFNSWNKAALRDGKIMEDWIRDTLENAAQEEFEPRNVTPMPTTKKSAHIMAAAGQPLEAEVLDWGEEGDDGRVRVKISGLSMDPKFADGDTVEMLPKRFSRSPFMKKGLIYLVEYDGGYTVKRYNTR